MSAPRRRSLIALLVSFVCLLLLQFDQSSSVETASAQVLSAEGPLKWYRGNIHTHSLWSDSDDYPEMIARWYKLKDYFDANVELVWFVDPRSRPAQVFTTPAKPTTVTEQQSLDGGTVLPGFTLSLGDLFQKLKSAEK